MHFTQKIEHTNNLTNNISRHSHNTYEHNAIKQVTKHMKHINDYGTEVNCYNQKSLNKIVLITSTMVFIFVKE